jgi:hypothetical protein
VPDLFDHRHIGREESDVARFESRNAL